MTISEHTPALDDGPTTTDLPTQTTPGDQQADQADQLDAQEELVRSQRLGAWLEVGATSLPALIVALGSALVGAVTMVLRRRRRS